MEENNRVNDDELEGAAGGMIFNSVNSPIYDPIKPWKVINNNNGEVLESFPERWQACEYAKRFGPDSYNTMEVGWETVDRLRKNPNVF